MEWIISFLLAFLVISTIAQLIWAYSLSAIAEKDGQSDLMQVLAWIPILQIAPMIVAGGGSVVGFLIGVAGLIVGAVVLGIASAVLGGTVGATLGGLALVFATLLSVIYFGRICWTTAVGRNLSGWIGLLLFVPLVNFFVYPFIAFHDGWSAPNKLGLVMGLVLTIGSSLPSFQTLRMLNQEGGLPPEFAALMSAESPLQGLMALETSGTNHGAPTPNATNLNSDGVPVDEAVSIRALYSLRGRFENLTELVDSPDIQQPARKQHALALLQSIDAELKAHRSALDSQTYQQLATELVRTEARIHDASIGASNAGGGFTRPQTAPVEMNTFATPGPAAIPSFSNRSSPPVRPIPIQAKGDCPAGTQLQTRPRGEGEEEWCQQHEALGGLRHGWYAHYLAGGQPESMGEYENGLRVGVWTRFYESGRVRAQAQFESGLQHGWLLSFDESGERTNAVRFNEGVATP